MSYSPFLNEGHEMANVGLSMRRARKRTKEEKAESKARFKEILSIVKKYDVKEDLLQDGAAVMARFAYDYLNA